MNPKPSGNSAAGTASASGICTSIEGEDTTATASRKPGYSANHVFLVSARLKGATPTAAEKPLEGTNPYILRIVHGDDLTSLNPDLQATATYFKMPKKPTTHTYNATVQKQDDGSLIVSPSFQKKSGTFQVHVELTEGGVHDEYVFTVVYAAPPT
jgi:hypothetical protein